MPVQDPFAIPESHISLSVPGAVLCAFSPDGNLLATGSSSGKILIWDILCQSVVRVIQGHVSSITVLCWSHDSRELLSASRDWTCQLWNVDKSQCLLSVTADSAILVAELYSATKSFIFIPAFGPPKKVHYDSKLTVSEIEPLLNIVKELQLEISTHRFTCVALDESKNIYLIGDSKGFIYIVDAKTSEVYAHSNVCSMGVLGIKIHTESNSVLVNCADRSLRVFDLEGWNLNLVNRFQDNVDKEGWNFSGFNANGQYITGASGKRLTHRMFVWDRIDGSLIRIIEGPPREDIFSFQWHPLNPMIASISNVGTVHLWTVSIIDDWAAFAPGFEILEDNVDYLEHENEFDQESEDELEETVTKEEDVIVHVGLPKQIKIPDYPLTVHLYQNDLIMNE